MRKNIIGMAIVLFMVCFAWSIEPAQSQDNSFQTELQKFQGTWVMVSAEMDGKKVHDDQMKQSKITFVGDKVEVITPHQHKEKIIATIKKFDTTKTPKEMHYVRSIGPNAGTTVIAIYEFDGPDQHKICFDPAGKDTPKKFETKAESGHIWHTWKRVTK